MLYFSILLDSLSQSLHIAFTIIVPISVGIVPCKIDLGYLFWYIQRLIRFLVRPCGTAKTDHFFFQYWDLTQGLTDSKNILYHYVPRTQISF